MERDAGASETDFGRQPSLLATKVKQVQPGSHAETTGNLAVFNAIAIEGGFKIRHA